MSFIFKAAFTAAFLLIILFLFNCGGDSPPSLSEEEKSANLLPEHPVKYIELSGEASGRDAEISGLAWYSDYLILLPQYPYNHSDAEMGYLFKISKKNIYDYLHAAGAQPIIPQKISFQAKGLEKFNRWGSGYEAIIFNKDTVYCVLELMEKNITSSYIVEGIIDTIKNVIIIDSATIAEIPAKVNLPNLSFETITFAENNLVVISESNGRNIIIHPAAITFDKKLIYEGEISLPNIEYRITDATELDSNNNFWVINYFYPGEFEELKPAADSIVIQFGVGKSHLNSPVVERLLEFNLSGSGIHKTKRPPLYLKLEENTSGRNWEGIARLDDFGLLLVTDRFPGTILGLVYLNSH